MEFLSLLNIGQARPSKNVIVLGASGSVGSTAVNYISSMPGMNLAGVSVHSSINALRSILLNRSIKLVSISDEGVFDNHIDSLRLDYPRIKFFRGDEGIPLMIEEAHALGYDTVLTGIVGSGGIRATMKAIEFGMKIALANKETMVTAGPAIVDTVFKMRSRGERVPVFVPVDSEHNAIFQLVYGMGIGENPRVILTASGGPFRDIDQEQIGNVRVEDVLNHPTWKMGPKISVDSAGMVNKGLEIIEAHHLFSLPYERLAVLIHRESIVHGIVESGDGSYRLSASQPSMIFPIAHSMHFPEAVPGRHSVATDPSKWRPLQFEAVSRTRYPGFYLSLQAAQQGGTMPALFNGANEVAVALFPEGRLRFVDIPGLIETVMTCIEKQDGTDLELFIDADREGRRLAMEKANIFTRQ